MKSILKKELSDILEKIYSRWQGEGITLSEARDLYFLAKKKYLSSSEEARKQEASELMLKILFATGKISESFVKEWQNGELKPNIKELGLLKEGCDEVLVAFDNHFKEELSYHCAKQGQQFSTQYLIVKEKIRKIRGLIHD